MKAKGEADTDDMRPEYDFDYAKAVRGKYYRRLLNEHGQPIGLPVPDWTPPPLPGAIMEGRFCRVEPLNANAHSEDLYAAFSHDADGTGWTYMAYGPFKSLQDYRDWITASCAGPDPMFFAILDKTDGKAVGVASFLNIDRANGCVEVGHIMFSPRLKRTPIATEAMYLMMKQAFDLGYRRYFWKCDSLNAASRTAAQRLGLSFEGLFRQAVIYKNRNRDTAWYAAIDAEWPALRKAFETWLAPDNFDDQGLQKTRLSDLTRPILKHTDTFAPLR